MMMRERTFVALFGAFGILFLITTVSMAREVSTHGAKEVSAPVFPAMALGALVSVVVMRVGSAHRGLSNTATAFAGIVFFAAVPGAGLSAWFLAAG